MLSIDKQLIVNLAVRFLLGVCLTILFSLIHPMNNLNPIRIEAENYQEYRNVFKGNQGRVYRNDDSSKNNSTLEPGFHIGGIYPGEWSTYDLDVPLDGIYRIAAVVKTRHSNDRKFTVSLDGEELTTFKFNNNNNPQQWQKIVSAELDLNKGSRELRLDLSSYGFAIDYLELIPVSVTDKDEDDNEEREDNENNNITQPKAVKIGGGGFVTGIVIHPEAKDVMYARTDVGGLYRWDADNRDWHQLLSVESVGQKVSLAVESVAIDPNNTNIVYAATGAFTHTGKGKKIPGNILKSTDKGNTWQVLDLALPVGGNEEWRWTGERLAVDPHDSNVVYFGSRVDGLWRSQDGGNSWSQIDTDSIPVGKTWGETKGVPGVTFIEFDRSSPGVVYVGVAGEGVYQTTNGGKSWQSLGEIAESLIPQQGEVNADGELVVTLFDRQNKSSNGGIWKFNGSTWEDVTPKTGKNYVGLTVNDSNPNTLFAVTYPMTPKDIYRSTDGGETWTALNSQSQGLDWYPSWNFYTLSGDLAVNPSNANQVWLTNGFGIWQTEQGKANQLTWSAKVEGLEETVPFDAISTPDGANLITAIADFDGFRHTDVTATPTKNHSNGGFSTTTSIAYSAGNPNFLVRVGGNQNNFSKRQAGFSTDNGVTWQNFESIQTGTHPHDLSFGNVAVSATNTDNIIWQGSNWVAPYYTKDRGQTWKKITYFEQQFGGGAHTHLWNSQKTLAADSIAGDTFYLYHHVGGKLVRTQDGGETWSVANQNSPLPKGAWTGVSVKTLPGVEGEVWAGFEDKGLYRSSNGGETFTQIEGVEYVDGFGFGKSAPNTDNPTLFVSGTIEGSMGVFGSTDLGDSWSQVSNLPNQFLGDVRSVTGDMNTFGRVYLGVESNGFIYGDL